MQWDVLEYYANVWHVTTKCNCILFERAAAWNAVSMHLFTEQAFAAVDVEYKVLS